jgi:peroxiredoxin
MDDVSGVEERPQNRREWRGALQSLALPALLIAAIVVTLYVLQERNDDRGTPRDDAYGIVELPAERNPSGRAPQAHPGRAAPDFVLETIEGEQVRLSDLQGRAVLLYFFATWCTQCRRDMADLVATSLVEDGSDTLVLAVNVQEAPEVVEAFARDFGVTFQVLIDRTGEVAAVWDIDGPEDGLPDAWRLSPEGVVERRVVVATSE